MSGSKPWKPWSKEEVNRLFASAAANNKVWDLVGVELQRSAGACKQKFNEEERRLRRPPLPMRRKPGGGNHTIMKTATEIAAQARREIASLPPRSLTAEFCGDPLPGRSALDRRQAEAAPRSISLGGGAS